MFHTQIKYKSVLHFQTALVLFQDKIRSNKYTVYLRQIEEVIFFVSLNSVFIFKIQHFDNMVINSGNDISTPARPR